MNSAQLAVLAEALDQYVSNTEEALESASDARELEEMARLGITWEKLALAQDMLDVLNERQASVAL